MGIGLKKESLFFKIGEKNISELANMDIIQLDMWFEGIEKTLSKQHQTIAHEIIREIRNRIRFLLDVGVDYLTLNRSSKSLSGGEAQRIRLATQIGSQLVGVLYILDEPSIGLHHRDNLRLIKALQELRDVGNSVIVVEHDKETILAADHVIDIGPGAGRLGGKIVAQGDPKKMMDCNTLTCDYISGRKEIKIPEMRRNGQREFIELKGAKGNNLKEVDLKLPLASFVCVTGVSGSGKSTLINETLYPILSQHFFHSVKKTPPLQIC